MGKHRNGSSHRHGRRTQKQPAGATTRGSHPPRLLMGVVGGAALLLTGVFVGWLLPATPGRAGAAQNSAPAAAAVTSSRTSAPTWADGAALSRSLGVIDDGECVYARRVLDRLEGILHEKKRALLELFTDIAASARAAAHDDTLLACFYGMREAFATQRDSGAATGAGLTVALDQYRTVLNQYYACRYNEFYDMLFVTPDRWVFYSIRQEADCHTQIDVDSMLADGLRRALVGGPHDVVIDFFYYQPSARPAAFFILPVVRNGRHEGWIVVQYAVNMLNALLVDYTGLGNSGEVYLLNEEHRMVTESRFDPARRHLQFTLDLPALDESGAISGMMIDYRGVRVLASCERLSALGQQWTLVAQMDEAEVITDHYRRHPDRCLKYILRAVTRGARRERALRRPTNQVLQVDMDEARRTRPGRGLETCGVSSCTAVALTYPEHFGYLAHLSPYDGVYGEGQSIHTLGPVLRRIRRYDIYPSELSRLRVDVVAKHTQSIGGVLDMLLAAGITLNQVRFVCNPDARYANVLVGESGREVIIEWVYADERTGRDVQWAADVVDLGTVVREACRVDAPLQADGAGCAVGR